MRTKPYTEKGIKRVKCFRFDTCFHMATRQWNICSDDNVYRGICNSCDIELNELVLKFMGFENWRAKIQEYSKDMPTVTPDQIRIGRSFINGMSDEVKKKFHFINKYKRKFKK